MLKARTPKHNRPKTPAPAPIPAYAPGVRDTVELDNDVTVTVTAGTLPVVDDGAVEVVKFSTVTLVPDWLIDGGWVVVVNPFRVVEGACDDDVGAAAAVISGSLFEQ